jgi:hypothetical protein
MAGDGLPVERLRDYLRQLKPGVRSLLIAELERGLLRGEEMLGAELVLQELRRLVRDSGRGGARIGNPARLFFRPLEPFLVDDEPDHKHRGRVARAVLQRFWEWLGREIMPVETQAFTEEAGHALAANDTAKAEQLTREFQDRAVTQIETALQAAEGHDKARRHIASAIGTPRGLEDVQEIAGILKVRHTLSALGERLPKRIGKLAGEQLNGVKAVLDSPPARNHKVFLYALLMVMNRLAMPWQLIRLATKEARSDTAARVAETHYEVAVTVALTEIERMVNELKAELHSGSGVALSSLLKTIHDSVRGIRTELDLPAESAWGKQLAHIRASIAELLKTEIESVPGRVRRLLRHRPSKEIAAGSMLDAGDVDDTDNLVKFVGVCRSYADELAINEMTLRIHSELQQYLEPSTKALVEALRNAGAGDRPFRRSQVDAAIRFCAKIFGDDYAAAIAKAAEVAANSGRKLAHA